MAYRVVYGDTLTVSVEHQSGERRAQAEIFSTEHEALGRARELIDNVEASTVAIYDPDGNRLGGVRLHLKLEASTD